MELKGSKTEANLWIAFAGESQVRNKYDYYASKAKKEGYEQIAALFQETALNEKEHAKLWFKALGGIGNTAENLVAAAAGEHEEWSEMYAGMARTAEEEGFLELGEGSADSGTAAPGQDDHTVTAPDTTPGKNPAAADDTRPSAGTDLEDMAEQARVHDRDGDLTDGENPVAPGADRW